MNIADLYDAMDAFMPVWFETHSESEPPSVKDIQSFYPSFSVRECLELSKLISKMYFMNSHI